MTEYATTPTSTAQDLVEAYLETWNAQDPDVRARLLERHWTHDCVYVDPLVDANGRDAVGATIGAIKEQFPGFVFTQVGTVDAHHQQCRFQWGLGPTEQEPVVIGFDVVVFDDSHLIHEVRGFLDKVPEGH